MRTVTRRRPLARALDLLPKLEPAELDALASAVLAIRRPAPPRYDPDTGELAVGGTVIQFATQAGNLQAVLKRLELLGWPRAIVNPLPQAGGDARKRLSDAARALNRRCAPHIRFHVRGDRLGWELLNGQSGREVKHGDDRQ